MVGKRARKRGGEGKGRAGEKPGERSPEGEKQKGVKPLHSSLEVILHNELPSVL